MLEYRIAARRIDAGTGLTSTTIAKVRNGYWVGGFSRCLQPTELLLAAIAACMIKGIERVTPMLNFKLDGVEVSLHAVRQDAPQRIVSVDYELIVDTDESDQRLELLHTNVRNMARSRTRSRRQSLFARGCQRF